MPFQIGAPLHSDPIPQLQWIEVSTSFQIPSFHIVGLPGQEISEARERVKAAIESSGFEFPRKRVVINLSPASVKKQGTGSDLSIALAVLAHSQKRPLPNEIGVACGELGLDGSIKSTGQTTRVIYAATQNKTKFLILPQEDEEQALKSLNLIIQSNEFKNPPPKLVFMSHLKEAWNFLLNQDLEVQKKFYKYKAKPAPDIEALTLLPLAPSLERVLCIATTGDHHLLLLGPKGIGKSHALDWLIALQAEPQSKDTLQQILLAELSSQITQSQNPKGFRSTRSNVRRISQHVKPASLIGSTSTSILRVGEFSLAHGGLFIADELLEWHRDSREALREPLERGVVTLTRNQGTLELPARFRLAANSNLCPCGGWPKNVPLPLHEKKIKLQKCYCRPHQIRHYLSKLSGPILDRIDLVLRVTDGSQNKNAAHPIQIVELKQKIHKIRNRLISKFGTTPGQLSPHELEKWLEKNPSWREEFALKNAMTLRSRHKILRLSLTLSAWDQMESPTSAHFLEASLYRSDRFGLGDESGLT